MGGDPLRVTAGSHCTCNEGQAVSPLAGSKCKQLLGCIGDALETQQQHVEQQYRQAGCPATATVAADTQKQQIDELNLFNINKQDNSVTY